MSFQVKSDRAILAGKVSMHPKRSPVVGRLETVLMCSCLKAQRNTETWLRLHPACTQGLGGESKGTYWCPYWSPCVLPV